MKVSEIPRGWLYTAIRICSLGALFFASMLAVDYYFVAHTFCEEGASCAVVAQSDFGQKYGIFLPTLGLLAYSFFFLTSFFFAKTREKLFGKSLAKFWLPLAIICCAIGAMGFIIIQATQIHAFCWLCMGIDTWAIIAVIPAVMLFLNKSDDEMAHEAKTKLHPAVWLFFYFLIACGPIAWGTRAALNTQQPQTTDVADNDEAKVVVPEYIKSFYKPGKTNIVEISSFDCPHCRRLHPQLSALLENYGDQINFTRLTIPLGKQIEACVAYYCAEKQKKETQFADCLFKEPSKDAGQLLEYARECSINEDAFKACVTSPESAKAVTDMLENIRKSGFQGAPPIWIDEQQIIGFNEELGMKPYKDAIELGHVQADDNSKSKIAFWTTLVGLILGIVCLLAGVPMSLTRRKSDSQIADNSEKSEEKSDSEAKDEKSDSDNA